MHYRRQHVFMFMKSIKTLHCPIIQLLHLHKVFLEMKEDLIFLNMVECVIIM